MHKIFLIDGHSQIFRMYYAFMRRPMVNSKGEDTSILFGFTKMLLELIAKEQPTHLAVAFDPPAKTFRHEAFPEYKANRSAAPELVKAALEPLQEILGAFNIPVVMIPGYEADDVIGSMATQWESSGNQIYMVTPDKDYGQLITQNIFQYKPGKGGNEVEIIGKNEVCANYGICEPQQVIDILTIWGDSSDNVPGIRGIGEVGAKKLVAKYGSLDGIIAHVDELPQKQQDSIKSSLDQIQMSRFLVTIKKDIELPVKLDDIKFTGTTAAEVSRIFNRFEFNSLKKILPQSLVKEGNTAEMPVAEAADTPAGDKIQIPEVKEVTIEQFTQQTTGCNEISVYNLGAKGIVVGCNNVYAAVGTNEFSGIAAVLESPAIAKTGYGFKQLYKELWDKGISLKGEINDIELMHYIINPERSHKEDMLFKSYLGIDLEEVEAAAQAEGNSEETVGKKETPKEPEFDLFSAPAQPDLFSALDETPAAETISAQDGYVSGVKCALLLMLRKDIWDELAQAGQAALYREIEAPLIEVLANMEYTGIKIDTAQLKEYSKLLQGELDKIESEAIGLAGESINLSSPKQVGVLLYEKLQLNPKVKKSAKGSYPTDEETLNELLDAHPIVGKILEYRGIKKLISTYTDALPELINPATGKIHTTFNQSLTATGRLSSTNPNLQNILIRTQRGREIRRAFIPSTPGGVIVSADYSQIELRLMAHMSGDPHLIEAFNRGMDIHTATAAKVFKVAEDQVTKEQRSRAKTANFGIIYGISAFGLSQRLGMTRTDSKALIEEYFINYPKVKEYMNNMIAMAKEKGYVETIYGRKRFLPDINSRNAVVRSFSERNAINAPLQGSAADIIKVAMTNIFRRISAEGLQSKMVLQVHDELVFDVVASEVEQICNIVTSEMENVLKLSIPLLAECGKGNNWLEAH
ncbi:MAG: DNA polymerase I [Bacteroidales bacterium]|nr:DNA polymerase I [Bacteroidales bacterium]